MYLNIYVANLGKYNEGYLVGDWLSLPATQEEINDLLVKIKVAHYDENNELVEGYQEGIYCYEEIAIHDFETDLESLEVNEYSNIDDLNELAEKIEGLNKWDAEKLDAIMEFTGDDVETAMDNIENYILLSHVNSAEELGYYYINEVGTLEIPDYLVNYFDYEAYGRDLSINSSGNFTSRGWLEYV